MRTKLFLVTVLVALAPAGAAFAGNGNGNGKRHAHTIHYAFVGRLTAVPGNGGVSITVEGVETEQQRVLLRLAGCDEMQGFLFARPAPAKAIDRLVKQPRPPETSSALTA